MNIKSNHSLQIQFHTVRSVWVWLVIVHISCLPGLAQPTIETVTKTRYTTENGLPQNSIKGLAFDQLGYCWIGTENGLVKYDGVHFRLYDAYDRPPTSSRVSYIKQNKQKEILVAFEGDQFYKIREFTGFGTRPVWVEGDYVVSDYPVFVDISNEPARSFFNLIKKKPLSLASDVYFILNDHQFYLLKPDSLWIGNSNGAITRIVDKRIGKYPVTVLGDKLTMILSNQVAIQYTNPDGKVQSLRTQGGFFDQLNQVNSPCPLLCTASGTYAFCQGKLYKLTLKNRTIYSTLLLEGLADFTPNNLYYDQPSGTYYLQSAIDGLVVVRPNRFQHVRIPNGTWRQNSFYGQSTYGPNQIVANGALFTFNQKNRAPVIQQLISSPYSFMSTYLQQDTYYYEMNFGLRKYNMVTRQDSLVSFMGDYIHCFNRSTYDSTLYYSTSNKLYSLKRDKPQCVLVLHAQAKRYIYGFTFLNADSVLIATNRGLLGASLRTGKAKPILSGINVRTIYVDKDRYIWLGTYNNGIYLLKAGRAKHIPNDTNKRLNVINSIFEDHQGRIWFSTNNGLLSARRHSITDFFHGLGTIEPYTLYTKSDGLLTNEFNGGAYPDKVYLADGRISLPTIKGLVVFNPDAFPIDRSAKKVFIDQVRVDGKLVKDLTQVTLPPDYNAMEISVSTPWLNKAETLSFERKAVGHDRQWITFSYGETIYIRDYSYGHYTMLIRIKGYPQSQIEYTFNIAPYYYETIWFKLGIALFMLLGVLAAFTYTITYYQRQTTSLDQKIRERTRALNESLRHLNLTVERLQVVEARLQTSLLQKDHIIKLLLHDMKSPLFALKMGIEELDDNLSLQVGLPSAIVRKSHLLREGINEVYSFSVNFFDWVKYQQEGLKPNYQLTRLSDVFGKIDDLYGSIATNKGIKLVIDPTEVICYTDENILFTILRNLIDNSIKYTEAGLIQLYVEGNRKDYLVITVADSGPGMAEPILGKIQDAFSEDLLTNDHAGYGYKLILHLVTLIHGDLELENKGGLQVRIILNYE
ncbi:ligand-binding sensor domain-containing protein [Spirosoma validum]|uniref:Histidine kinase domain-containing protein n=1 Tax=Spirosoma validum TaxID=2771355 RepID=A0A927GF31_9BACT|nr:HAMP domain-containing sensor histidine kinase [Spirosoma validum]MBD2755291.1 hypothetical protein [Spirosoma validum]